MPNLKPYPNFSILLNEILPPLCKSDRSPEPVINPLAQLPSKKNYFLAWVRSISPVMGRTYGKCKVGRWLERRGG